ncbi:MAG: Uma2 family endonuclease [Chitinophagaceae bacterium]
MEAFVKQTTLPGSLAEFDVWEPGDGFKYEWNDGEIVKFEGMKKKHLKLMRSLTRLFKETSAYNQGGELVHEQDVMLTGIQLRRPDLAYFSGQQIDDSGNAAELIPAFVIEVISTFDQIIPVKAKLKEYFQHGVQLVWLIYPDDRLVEIYTSFKNIQVCTDGDICSGSPVLTGFEIMASNLFL